MSWVQWPGLPWWKERTNSHKLFSDWHPPTHTWERQKERERICIQVLYHLSLGKQNVRAIQLCTPIGMAKIQNADNNKCWQRSRTQELFRMAGGDTKWYRCFRGQLIGFSPNQMHPHHTMQQLLVTHRRGLKSHTHTKLDEIEVSFLRRTNKP